MGLVHQVYERQVVLRFDEFDVVDAGEQSVYRFLYIWIKVDRVEYLGIGVRFGGLCEGFADAFKAATEAFAAVSGNEDEFFVGVEVVEALLHLLLERAVGFEFFADVEQCVDDGVTGDGDIVRVDAFVE